MNVSELIMLGVSVALGCEGCIAFHVHDAAVAGASRQQILDTIGVAVLMGGHPAALCGAQAVEAVCELDSPEIDGAASRGWY
jgi:AhpD family alkylhydroperoxidase